MVDTRSGKTPSKKSPRKKATSPLDAKLGDLSLTKQARKSRKQTPRKSLKQSPNPTGAASRRRQNATDKRKQTKQQRTKERRAAALAKPPSPPKDDKVVSLLKHKEKAAEMAVSLLSQVNNITAVGPNEINKKM